MLNKRYAPTICVCIAEQTVYLFRERSGRRRCRICRVPRCVGCRERRCACTEKNREKKNVDFARTIMQTCRCQTLFPFSCFSFSFQETPRRRFAIEDTRDTALATPPGESLRPERIEIALSRSGESRRTRRVGNWIRDFDQFRRQRRFAAPGANPEFTVRIATRLRRRFRRCRRAIRLARKEAYERGCFALLLTADFY